MSHEWRYTKHTVEVRASESGAPVLRGYAAKYNTLSQNLGGFVETIAPQAFSKTLGDVESNGRDIVARYNHDDNMLLGRTASGTLRVGSDSVGLWYEVDLPGTTVGRDLAILAARGDVYQSSFAFSVYADGDAWSETDQGYPLRTLTNVGLHDVSPVVSPAYLDTEAGLRSYARHTGVDLELVREAATAGDLRSLTITTADTETVPAEIEPIDDTTVSPQVDNRGLLIVRQRLLALRAMQL